jgi:flagellar motor switch protein FliN/FliY
MSGNPDPGQSTNAGDPLAPANASGAPHLSLLRDLVLPISVELGRTKLPVQEILSLGRGSVIQLDRLAGEPVEIFVGDRPFAQGEVVVLGDHFGVRITRILASTENVAKGSG